MAVEQSAETAEQAGIPQLDFTAFPNQIFWLAIFGLAIYLVISRLAKPRIGDIIDQREKRIQNALDSAERSRQAAAGLDEEIGELLGKARQEAERISQETRNEILQLQSQVMQRVQEKIAGETRKAESRLEAMSASADGMIDEIARVTAAEIVSRIMPVDGIADRVDMALAAGKRGSST